MLLRSRRLSILLAGMTIGVCSLATVPFLAADEVAVPGSITMHPTAIELRHQRQPQSLQVLGATADGFSIDLRPHAKFASADPKIATGSDTPQDVNSGPQRRNPGGINPLMAAAGLGSKEEDTVGRKKTEADAIEAITVCLDAGVNINAVDGRGQTALYGAALQGYDGIVKFLLSKGADPKIKDQRGFTALDAADGKAGGFGFGGGTANPHPSTAKILRDAM